MFFISNKNFDGKIVNPRVPLTRASCEDSVTNRICVAESIKDCFNATLDTLCSHYDNIFVHECTGRYIIPTKKQVHDSSVTNEMWIIEPVLMRLYDIFQVKIIYKECKNRLQYNFYGRDTGDHIIVYNGNIFKYYGRDLDRDLYDRIYW